MVDSYIHSYLEQVWEIFYRRTRTSQKMDRMLLRTIQPWELWWRCSSRLQSAPTPTPPHPPPLHTPEEDLQPILREEVEIAVAALKKMKSAGVDNIPADLVQAGRETITVVLTEICNKIWRTDEWPTPWTQSLIITLPKHDNVQLCQNYRTTSLISHSSKAMLKVTLNRFKSQAEDNCILFVLALSSLSHNLVWSSGY